MINRMRCMVLSACDGSNDAGQHWGPIDKLPLSQTPLRCL